MLFMAKYNHIQLTINQGVVTPEKSHYKILKEKNIIYIYRNSDTKKMYVGQTKDFISRHTQHFNGTEEKFNIAKFDQVIVLYSQYFNKSALDDVETQLITYLKADCLKAKGTQNILADDDLLINLTNGNSVLNYKEREDVASKVVLPFWETVLYQKHWVSHLTIDELQKSALVKYSPIKLLTQEQADIVDEIANNSDKNYVINGDAGTGKTVLLTHLVARMSRQQPEKKIAVIVQPNWRDTGDEIFKVYGLNSNQLEIGSSTQIINTRKEFDVIIIDESHKLSRRGNKQHFSFGKVYSEEFADYQSHLEILKRMGQQIILMYDILQAIRPANIPREQMINLTKSFEQRYLKTQFRIQANDDSGCTSEDYINGIKYLLYKDTGLLEYTNFNPNFKRELFKNTGDDSYFGYFQDKPLHNLFDWIDEDININPEHINRVLGGLVEPWKQKDGQDLYKYHWVEGELKCRWNSTQENWINSEDIDASEQIGSVFAVQGIDLNKVGVLIGDDLQVNSDGNLYAERENFHNVNGVFSESEAKDKSDEFTLLVLNIYYVLLTRGIDGIRIGFWHNDNFKKYFKETLQIID